MPFTSGRGIQIACLMALLAPSSFLRCSREVKTDGRSRLSDAVTARGSRPIRGRLSAFAYTPFGGVTRGPADGDVSFLAVTAQQSESRDPHVAGVAALLRADSNRAVDRLRRATADGKAASWNDLAAAYLADAERKGKAEPLLDALAAVATAKRIAPNDAAVAFNEALALEALGLRSEAREAWVRSRQLDGASGWSAEAASAARRLEQEIRLAPDWKRDRVQLEAAADAGDLATVRRFVRLHPRDARLWGEGAYPASWAKSTGKGDAEGAGRQLTRARIIGEAFALELREQLLRDSIAVIDAATASKRAALAKAYLAYRTARMEHVKRDAAAPAHLHDVAADFENARSPMQFVAKYYEGSALYGEQRLRDSLAILDDLALRHFETRGYLALAAQIGWERGLANLSLGNFTSALEIFDRSRKDFDSFGDAIDSAVMRSFEATTYDAAGDFEQAWTTRRDVLQSLAGEGQASWRMGTLIGASSSLIRREQWDRALPLLDIVVDRTRRTDDTTRLCVALAYRAATLASKRLESAARADLVELSQRAGKISDARVRAALLLDAHYAEALLFEGRDDGKAIAELTAAIDDAQEAGRALFGSRLFLERARVHRRMGRREEAHRDVLAGLDQNERNRSNITDEALRAMATLSSETLFQEGIALALERGDVAEAFELSERMRARALLELFEARIGGTRMAPLSLRAVQSELAPDAAILEFVLLPDRVVQFVVTQQEARAFENPVAADTVRDVAQSAAAAVHGRGDPRPLAEAAALFLGPSAAALQGVAHLAIVPDRALTAVPFGALGFPGSSDLLVERSSITIAPSASLAIECSRRASNAPIESALAIGATEFDPAHFAGLSPLPAVAGEARAVASAYRSGELLVGDVATPRTIVQRLPHANVIHFAGHSVAPRYDGFASTLVLASDGSTDRLTARDIARLRLPNASLVMLSSCRSAQAGTAGDGVENLATAFLVAGAPSVLGASWDIDDEAARAIALSIHQEYRASRDIARAFQATVRNPNIRSQNAWRLVTPFGGSPSLVRKGEGFK
jgi:CHAT domain-containing protein